MGIRSKNIRYSKYIKALAIFLIWASIAGFCVSAVYLIRNNNEYKSKDFHTTDTFINEFTKYTSYVLNYAIRLRSEEYIKAGNTLPAGVGANEQTGGLITREEYISNELEHFNELEKQLSSVTNFGYIVVERDTGLYTTNMKMDKSAGMQERIDRIKKQPFRIFLSKNNREASYPGYRNYFYNMNQIFGDTSFEMYAAVLEPLKKGDAFYESWDSFNNAKKYSPVFLTVLPITLLLGILSLVFLIVVAGRNEKGGKIKFCFIDRIFTDVQTVLVIIAAGLSVGVAQNIGSPRNFLILALYLFILLSIDMIIGLSYILSMARHFKNKSLLKHTLLYVMATALARFVKLCLGAKTFRISVIVFLLIYAFLNSIFFAALTSSNGSFAIIIFLLWAALNVAAVYILSKSLVSLSDIMKWVRRISIGNLTDSPDISKLSPVYSSFANDVQNLQSGLKSAISEAIKGERLKTDLITNVSHDLKTPLTSIISYVDLLRKEETDNGNIREYAAILEEKSNRLKHLIDDLLEVSKAASGNVSVSFESIDLYSLTLQASAEFNEKAAAAGLDFRIKPVEKAPVIHADGRLMWRIMENLLSNVLKYSQKDSRVYMDVGSSETYGTITIKNISSLPLDVPADQLIERFVRGDRSRSKEGSGLGLAIAKSLAEVQGGKLEVLVDGDLFKVSVSIPLENQ